MRPLLASAWAKRGHLTIADALYVVLAEQLSATLVTADFNPRPVAGPYGPPPSLLDGGRHSGPADPLEP
ncbi:MAG: hypothetical protein M3Q68_02360, partial [Actinomycetota bacterium]|nr:hypothetical protein [Actinomycetota bacterium]